MSARTETERELITALRDVLREFWTGRKMDVRKQYHAMVVENEARKLLQKLGEPDK